LGATYNITQVVLKWEAAYGKSYKIQTSADASTWTDIYSTTTGDGGTDTLTVSGSGRYVRMYGTVRATTYGYSLWEFEVYGSSGSTGPQNNSIYHLKCQSSGKSLDNAGSTTDGTAVTQYTDSSGNSHQEWKAVDAGGGYFRLICQNSGKALDNSGSTTEGTTVNQWAEQSGNSNQNWRFVDAGGGYFRLICQKSGKALDNGGSTTDGTIVKQWTEQPGNSNQNWQLVFIR
jgi:mannan endo-1,4-beta-mannosidase